MTSRFGEDPPAAAADVGEAVQERPPAELLDGPVGVEARLVVDVHLLQVYHLINHLN